MDNGDVDSVVKEIECKEKKGRGRGLEGATGQRIVVEWSALLLSDRDCISTCYNE